MPRIIIFQKDIDLPKKMSKADSDSRFAFLEKLNEKDKEHFPVQFENADQLMNELGRGIDRLLNDESFTKQLKTE